MSDKRNINKGLQIGTQNNRGGIVNNAARDINVYQDKSGISIDDLQSLLDQISSEIQKLNIPQNDKKDISANVETAINQTKKEEPKKNLIVGPLSTAFELLVQAGGAAKAVESILPLFQKAISFAQNLF